MIKEETPYTVPKYPHFLAVWTKFETFYFQLFCSKKRKSTDQRKTFISGFTCSKKLSNYLAFQSLGYEHSWWRFLHKCVVHTKPDIYLRLYYEADSKFVKLIRNALYCVT